MTKQKSIKRALLLSALSLLMCVSMLIGSTYAWFTDTASTGVNTIQSGTLDVALEYSIDGTNWNNAEGKTLAFKDLDDNTYWEPGCTYELPAIRVRNNGNLALKYDIVINGVTGNAKLLEAIEFTANGNAISNFSGHLDTNGAVSESIVIKGHMKEEAGNEYQGLELEGIGITVYATQYTYEKDSYDNMYDKVGAIGGGRIEKAGERWQISADFAATGVKTLAVNVVDTNGNIITTVTPETFEIPDNGVIGDPTDGSQYSWKTICAVVTGDSSSWQNTAFVPTMDAVPATMELVINGEVVDVSTITYGADLWDDAVKAYNTTSVNSADELQAALTNGGNIVLADDIELTNTLIAKKDVVIDLNGKTISANMSQNTLFQSSSDTKPSMTITSSKSGAKINAGGKSVLLGYGSTEFSNVEINVGEIKSSSYTTFNVRGDLTLGEGTVVNVDYLGTSLISNNAKAAIVIDGAQINVGTFKVNGGAMISLTKGTTVALKGTEVKVGLDTTYTSYFINNINNEDNVTIEDCTFTVTDTDDVAYGIQYKADASVGDKYVWVQK